LGCLGCGCAVLGLIVLLVVVVIGSIFFVCYKTVMDATSTTPPSIPPYTATDVAYESVRQKLGDFDHDVTNHLAAKMTLSGDELNTLIARNPDAARLNIHAFVSFKDNEGRLQVSFPTELPSQGWVKGRFASFDISFSCHFNPATKSVEVEPHTLTIGDKQFVGPNAESNQQAQAMLNSFVPMFNTSLNQTIRKSPDGAALLNQAKSIEIQDSQVVIETQ
jgi:hypothetical protein